MPLRISFISFVSLLESQLFAHCYMFLPDETVSCDRERSVSIVVTGLFLEIFLIMERRYRRGRQ